MAKSAKSTPKNTSKTKRRFSSGDPVFDEVYRATDDRLRSEYAYLLKPLKYEFDEANNLHIMTLENRFRFEREEGSPVVKTFINVHAPAEGLASSPPSPDNIQWEACVAHHLGQGYVDMPCNPSPVATNTDEDVSLANPVMLSQATPPPPAPEMQVSPIKWSPFHRMGGLPVMWPVGQSNASFSPSMGGIISKVMNEEIEKMRALHPQKFSFNEDPVLREEFHKKSFQVHHVLNKTWNAKLKHYRMSNVRSGVFDWWHKFVDRSILKTCVAIVGNQKGQSISWFGFAGLTQQPNLQQITQHIQALGSERFLLADLPFDEWNNHSASNLIKGQWSNVWDEVSKLPLGVQSRMLRQATNEAPCEGVQWSNDDPLSPYRKPNKKNIDTSVPPVSWQVFEELRQSFPKAKPRELEMIWIAAISTVKNFRWLKQDASHPSYFDLDKHALWQDLQADMPLLKECLQHVLPIWRVCEKNQYRKWSAGVCGNWGNDWQIIVQSSLPKGELSFDGLTSRDKMRGLAFKAKYDEMALKQALQQHPPKRATSRKM